VCVGETEWLFELCCLVVAAAAEIRAGYGY